MSVNGRKKITRQLALLTVIVAIVAWSAVTNAQEYTRDDFAGMGISAGQAARMAERANQSSAPYSSSDFSGIGPPQKRGTTFSGEDHNRVAKT